MRRLRRAQALFAVICLLVPGALAAVAHTSRVAERGEHDHHDEAADWSLTGHGHPHEAATPAHDHPLLFAGAGFRVPTMEPSVSGTSALCPRASVSAAGHRGAPLHPPHFAGTGPPPSPERLAVLRI